MFENLKLQIAKELVTKDINNLEEYINELHEILPKYLNKVPNRYTKSFYEFASKFMKYLFENQDEWENDIIADIGYPSKIFMYCYNEYYKIDIIFNDDDNSNVTKSVIKILQSYCNDTNGIIGNLDEAKQILMEIFSLDDIIFINNLKCDWNKVSESITFNDFTPLKDEDNEGIIFYDDQSIKELKNDGVDVDWYKGPGTYNTFDDFKPVNLTSDSLNKDKYSFKEFKNDNNGEYYPKIYNWDKLTDDEINYYFKEYQENKTEVNEAINNLKLQGYLDIKEANKNLPQPKRTKNMEAKGIYPYDWLLGMIEKKHIWENLDDWRKDTKLIKKVICGYGNDGILKYFYDLLKNNDSACKYISIDYNELKGTFFKNEKPGYIGRMSGDLRGTRIVALTIDKLKIYTTYSDRLDTTGFW